jgi:hypothetical protein
VLEYRFRVAGLLVSLHRSEFPPEPSEGKMAVRESAGFRSGTYTGGRKRRI